MTFIVESGPETGQLRSFLAQVPGAPIELRDRVVDVPKLELSTSEMSQLDFVLSDPDFSLLASGALGLGTRIDFGDIPLEVAAAEVGGDSTPTLAVTLRSAGIMALKRKKGALVVSDTSPTDFAQREAESVGLGFVGEPSAALPQIARTAEPGEEPESSWDVITNLANELGYITFEAKGVLYFGKPTWLIANAGGAVYTVRYPAETSADEWGITSVPSIRRVEVADQFTPPVTGTITLPYDKASKLRPGDRINLVGIPTFEAEYMVTTVPLSIDGVSPVGIGIETPTDPEPKKEEPYNDPFTLDGLEPDPSAIEFFDPLPVPGGTSDEWSWPCTGQVTSGFGPRGGRMHEGIDIGVGIGTRIHAAQAGTVVRAEFSESYGNVIYIDHGGGRQTRYAHLSEILVRKGQDFGTRREQAFDTRAGVRQTQDTGRVERGQLIGLSGNTGRSTGPHLHFEMLFSGRPDDPMKYLPAKTPVQKFGRAM